MNKPSGCLVTKPTKNSVLLGGVWINISAIARTQGLYQPQLTRILSGETSATIPTLRKICTAIGFDMEQLIDAIELRRVAIAERKRGILQGYQTRVAEENAADSRLEKKGQPVPARIPAFRLPEDRTAVK